MDYQKFVEQLPSLYENWGRESVVPKSKRFQQALDQVQGMTTANVMQLLNFAVECMEPDEIYCEIGCYQGSTLIGALLDHPERMAYAVDNFSEFDQSGENLDKLINNLSSFDIQDRVYFCNQDFEEFLLELREINPDDKIGVYLYDGAHDYRSQLLGLLLIKPFLAEKALIIIDDSNWEAVRQANWDFMAANPECELLLELLTPGDGYHTFWNGIQVLSWDANKKANYSWNTFSKMRRKSVIQAIYELQFIGKNERELDNLYQEALSLHEKGQFLAAEKKYCDFIRAKNWDTKAWLSLGILYYEAEQYQKSVETIFNLLKIDSSVAQAYYILGLAFEKINQNPQAISAYTEAIALEPKLIEAYNNLGNLLSQAGESEQAEAVYRQAIAANPSHFGSYLNLGNLLMEQNQIEQAIEVYKTALTLIPDNPDILNNLAMALEAQKNPTQALLNFANKLYQQEKYEAAIKQYQKLLEIQTGDAEVYFNLSDCFTHLNRVEEAINTLKEGIFFYPTSGKLHFYFIKLLQENGRIKEAISSAEKASQILPNEYVFKIFKNLILPTNYNSANEISFYRQRFIQGIQSLILGTFLEEPEDKKNALAGISCVTNFFLAYQAHNDLELQRQYGNLVHQIMAANYPQWVQAISMPPLKENKKIRVGYVSAFLHGWSGTFLSLGYLRYCNQQDFEFHCYYTGNQPDNITELFRNYSDAFHHIPNNLEAVCEQIVADKLHILVFPEIGMDAATMQLAGLRLAPAQCVVWGHPVTTGLPTIDYFLSSELMEPENAQAHYSETLIRLPNVGVAYPSLEIPPLTKTRADFQLRDDAVVYLSSQAPYKYLPQHDYIFAEIARRVPQAQFMFLRAGVPQERLERAFSAVGLNSKDYCVFSPVLPRAEYLMLNLVSDIYLDTLSWSGGNTTLDAIACSLPVVTCPGEFMRGRHSYGFLKRLEVTDTIAQTETEYIDIAVKLGLDPIWRRDVSERIKARHDYLYDDKSCVAALEDFYKQVVQKGLTQT
ncbi:tetratricopeptide repeat protein [Coleofasciculus sp. FACHB-SPT36]|uniref:O-linked N-acetylglucosamine transferase family protein n=1 Tax=Cyanophyceae TaxID=3028117 RepID=UPI00168ADEA1|nr:tetratricopeptide repeat protein [Coleofasciculus sp. FACHB-SPT36]MBD2541300.1 tetratricopeptide repeat protein [Coleofasciculus sp. FACHB-SPT36]